MSELKNGNLRDDTVSITRFLDGLSCLSDVWMYCQPMFRSEVHLAELMPQACQLARQEKTTATLGI
jgi:hypothetical protein